MFENMMYFNLEKKIFSEREIMSIGSNERGGIYNFKVEIEITWAVTQPTDLTMRVKWSRW